MYKVVLSVFILLLSSSVAFAAVKLRDIAQVEGIRDNQLFGYGLVVGLNGTGDKTNTAFTIQSLVNMLDGIGITVPKNAVRVKNVAAVTVTAKLPPFGRSGSKIDVTVSSIGDAKSLEGGTLLLTPLSAANNQIYAVSQGPLSIGGLNTTTPGGNQSKNHATVATIPNGATIEKEVPFELDRNYFTLTFTGRGLSDVVQAKSAINSFLGVPIATITSPSTVRIDIPSKFKDNYYDFMSTLLNIEIQPETFAKVIIDERTGTVVMGSEVRISTVALAHKNLTITITNQIEITQPNALNTNANQNAPEPSERGSVMMLPDGVTISDLVKALNSMGIEPRDLIPILKAIKASGALHAALEIM